LQRRPYCRFPSSGPPWDRGKEVACAAPIAGIGLVLVLGGDDLLRRRAVLDPTLQVRRHVVLR
jgi:hypothetical protein